LVQAAEELAQGGRQTRGFGYRMIDQGKAGELDVLPRSLIWIERYLTFEGDPLEFTLVEFAFWRPRPAVLGTDGRFALGTARREPITGEDLRRLVA
jgi:hypothetical protein